MDENDLDLPFEAGPPGQTLDLSDGHIAGGMVVMAAAAPAPDGTTMPALVFRFAKPDGSGFYPPMLVVLAPNQMAKMPALVAAAAAAAIKAAS